jgi:hypothetical protein
METQIEITIAEDFLHKPEEDTYCTNLDGTLRVNMFIQIE